MKESRRIPLVLRRLFDPLIADDSNIVADAENSKQKGNTGLCESLKATPSLKAAGVSGGVKESNKNQAPSLSYICREALVHFVTPDEECVSYPSARQPSKQEIEERGEFWVYRAGQLSGATLEFDVSWPHVLCNAQRKIHVQQQTILFMKWVHSVLTKNHSYSSTTKRKACSTLFDLVELLFSIGSRLSLLHVTLDLGIEKGTSKCENNPCLNKSEKTQQNALSVEEVPENQKLYTKRLLKACKALIAHGSNREAYVSLTSVLHNKQVGFLGRLLVLPLFAKVLNTFPSKQASFLMSVNTTIHARLLTEKDYIEAAEQDLSGHYECPQEASLDPTAIGTPSKCDIKQNDNDATLNNVVLPNRPPFYLEWVVGSALYIVKYFKALGRSRVVKQDTDLHGVGPNSCTSLLAKVITFLGLTFEVDWSADIYSVNPSSASEQFHDHALLKGLRWNPLGHTPNARKNKVAAGWEARLCPVATNCLTRLTEWFVQSPKRHSALTPFENVNTVSPLDDGGGELELTPLASALAANICCLQQASVSPAHFPKALPLVLDPQRFAQIAFSNAYVLLHCGTTLPSTDSSLPAGTSPVETCFMCETVFAKVLALRQERAVNQGIGLFYWACTAPHCVPSLKSDFFDSVFGLSVKPQRLIAAILMGVAQRSRPFPKMLCTQLLRQCNLWLKRYTVTERLKILEALLTDITGATVGPVAVATVHIFKEQLRHLVSSGDKDQHSLVGASQPDNAGPHEQDVLLSSCLKKVCRLVGNSDYTKTLNENDNEALCLEILNVWKTLAITPCLQDFLKRGKPDVSLIHCSLQQLARDVDLSQQMANSVSQNRLSSGSSVSQLVPFVLREVRLLYDQLQ